MGQVLKKSQTGKRLGLSTPGVFVLQSSKHAIQQGKGPTSLVEPLGRDGVFRFQVAAVLGICASWEEYPDRLTYP